MRRIAILIAAALCVTAPAAAHDLVLSAEHAEVVRLPAEASAVIVGNPSIADAMVHDGRTLVISARLPGRTNVIAVDRVGRVIYSREIAVTNDTGGQVALFRGPNRYTLSCVDTCEEIPRVGDETERAVALTDQQRSRLSIAETAVGGDDAGAGPGN